MTRRLLCVICVLLVPLGGTPGLYAPPQGGDPGHRTTTLTVNYTEYEWWLTRWSDNTVVCPILVEHEGVPTGAEIFQACGKEAHAQWLKSAPCAALTSDTASSSGCPGYYLHFADQTQRTREVEVLLPKAEVWITFWDCQPPDFRCGPGTALMLVGHEPLPNEQITAIHGTWDGLYFNCRTPTCPLPTASTPEEGVEVEFWAESSFGDATEVYTARVRTLPADAVPGAADGEWTMEVLSSQWRGPSIGSCAEVWDAFPPPGAGPDWLSTPSEPEGLASATGFEYLAGRLIAAGIVDTTECPSGGLGGDGSADACGLEVSRPTVELWQNRFDSEILEAAQEAGIPARLLKNLISLESQFWPGATGSASEIGLGQLSENGVDTVLLWDVAFYEQFCPLVLDASACRPGYAKLSTANRAMLRGAYLWQHGAQCSDCPYGVDLSHAGETVGMVAQVVQANCGQVGRMVYNTAKKTPGRVSSYEDLWRFTLASYNAGPGCLAQALQATWRARQPLDWVHVSSRLDAGCQGAIDYVERIAR